MFRNLLPLTASIVLFTNGVNSWICRCGEDKDTRREQLKVEVADAGREVTTARMHLYTERGWSYDGTNQLQSEEALKNAERVLMLAERHWEQKKDELKRCKS